MSEALRIYDPVECDERGVPLDWENSLKAAALAHRGYIAATLKATAPYVMSRPEWEAGATSIVVRGRTIEFGPLPIRCEDCGHPMSEGTWEGDLEAVARNIAEMTKRAIDPRDEMLCNALDVLRSGQEPMWGAKGQPVHFSPCDEGCRHGGPGRMDGPGGPDGTNVWMHFPAGDWERAAALTLAAGIAVEASWRQVDVRTLGWPHDLRPGKLAVLCLRCQAQRTRGSA